MIFDAQTRFSNAQAVTASAASTNVIDLRAAGIPYGNDVAVSRDLGIFDIPLRIQVVTAFATATSIKVAVQTDDNSSFSSAATVLETEAIPIATLVAGYQFNIDKFPLKTSERYVRLYYTVAGSDATAGAITAGVVAANEQNLAVL
jgi:hypothetical protein